MKLKPMPPNTRHVMPGMDGGWVVRKHGSKRATKWFATKRGAVHWGRDVSRRHEGVLVIHRNDGTVESCDRFEGTHHVLRSIEGGWSVWREGTTRASKCFDAREEAVAWGRALSRKHGTELVIHRADGTVQVRHKVLAPNSRGEDRFVTETARSILEQVEW